MTRNERGFSLIEIIVSVVISGIILAAAAQATLIGLRTMDDTNQRIAGSNDTELVAGYFNSDIASSDAISTTGSTVHAAPSVTVSTANSVLAAFWTLKRGTTFTPPDSMSEVWDRASTGPATASQVTVDMADELVTSTGATGNRAGESADGTSSITQSVVLAPALLGSIARRDASSGSTGGAPNLTLSRPATTQNGDVLLAQVGVSGDSAVTVSTPSGWTLVDSRAGGATARSLIYSHTAATGDPLSWTWTFGATREAAGGIVAYSGVGSVGARNDDVVPCGGDTPALLLSWTDTKEDGSTVQHQVTYDFVPAGNENTLVRRHCTGTSGTPTDSATLARELASSSSVGAECQPASCGPLTSPVNVTLTLTEPPLRHSTVARSFQLRGSTRTNR